MHAFQLIPSSRLHVRHALFILYCLLIYYENNIIVSLKKNGFGLLPASRLLFQVKEHGHALNCLGPPHFCADGRQIKPKGG
jgi:hypothetical protein